VGPPAPVVPSGGGGGGGGGGGAGVSGVLFCTETITTNCVQPPGYIASSTATTSLKATSTVPLPVVFFPKSASSTTVCQPSIIVTSIIRPGDDTNTDLIKKIQIFLNRYEHAELDVTGVYDIGTVGAIMEFQKKYALQILVPWGIVEPNGLIYTTTVAKMNAIVCGEHLGCPVFTAFSKPDEVNIDAPKIKSLLNVTMGTKLNPNSEFMDKATTNAIKQFQTRYRTFILKPWGLKSATGWWYHTTARQANKFMGCEQKPIVLPNGQKLE
jgi:peptidoglycan hydrolase-like protein with peptidoglycan-binding domain